MNSFKYKIPESLTDLLEYYNEEKDACLVAGGSDLVVNILDGAIAPEQLVDISQIEELKQIKEGEGFVKIGPCCTHRQIVASSLLNKLFPYIVEASNQVGAEQTRSLGTIGGNICSAVPSTDLAPSLMAAGAKVVLRSIEGERTVNIEDFFTGPRKTVMEDNEVLIEIQVPVREKQLGKFIKFGRRKALSLAVVNVAVAVDFDQNYEKIEDIRIALGAVAPTPVRARKAEDFLRNKALSNDIIEKAAAMAPEDASPITDLRASAEYRLDLIKALTRKALTNIMGEASQCRP